MWTGWCRLVGLVSDRLVGGSLDRGTLVGDRLVGGRLRLIIDTIGGRLDCGKLVVERLVGSKFVIGLMNGRLDQGRPGVDVLVIDPLGVDFK